MRRAYRDNDFKRLLLCAARRATGSRQHVESGFLPIRFIYENKQLRDAQVSLALVGVELRRIAFRNLSRIWSVAIVALISRP